MDEELIYKWTMHVLLVYQQRNPSELITAETIRHIHDSVVREYDDLYASYKKLSDKDETILIEELKTGT